MTLELAHQLALTKLVTLLETLTDPAEIRRVATAILRIKPPKDPGAKPPQKPTVPLHRGDQSTQLPPDAPIAARAVPNNPIAPTHVFDSERPSLPTIHTTPAAHLIAIAGRAQSRSANPHQPFDNPSIGLPNNIGPFRPSQPP